MNRISHIAFTALLFLLLYPSSGRAAEWYIKYKNGLEAIKNQQWAAAISHLDDALNERGEERAKARTVGVQFIDYFPYLYRGLAYAKSGNNAKALADFERSEKQGEVFKASKDDEAQQILREYMSRLRTSAAGEKEFEQGRTFYRQKNYTAALERFRSVPESSPYREEAKRYVDLLQSDMAKEQGSNASTARQKPADTKPASRTETMFAEGVRLFDRQQYERAGEKFRAVLQEVPDHPGAQRYLNLSKSMKASLSTAPRKSGTDRSRRAGTDAGPTENSAPMGNDQLVEQATTLFRSGKLESARRLFLTVQSADPSRQEVNAYLDSINVTQKQIQLGMLAFFEGDYQAAVRQLNEAARVNAENVSLYGVLAAAYAAQYFLGGTEDQALQRNAQEIFRKARLIDGNYRLDGRYVSPRIVAFLNNQ